MRQIAVWGAVFAMLGLVTTGHSDDLRLVYGGRMQAHKIRLVRPIVSENTSIVLECPEPLPADAQVLVTAFDGESATNRQKAEQEIQAKRQALIVTLQALQDSGFANSQSRGDPRSSIIQPILFRRLPQYLAPIRVAAGILSRVGKLTTACGLDESRLSQRLCGVATIDSRRQIPPDETSRGTYLSVLRPSRAFLCPTRCWIETSYAIAISSG